jgi:hypothetical protein
VQDSRVFLELELASTQEQMKTRLQEQASHPPHNMLQVSDPDSVTGRW